MTLINRFVICWLGLQLLENYIILRRSILILLLGIISLIVKPGYIIQGQYTSLVANSSYIIFGKYMTKTFFLVRHSLMFKMILTAGLSLTFVRLIVKKVDFCVQSNFQALKMSTIYTFFEHNCNLLSCF